MVDFVTASTDITRSANTTAYSAGQALADASAAVGGSTLSSMGATSGGTGIITDVIVTSSNATGGLQGQIWIFDSAVTAVNDNATFGITDGEAKTLVAKVDFLLVADTNNATYHAQGLTIGYTCVGSANLRYLVRVGAAYTPANGEVITVRAKAIRLS